MSPERFEIRVLADAADELRRLDARAADQVAARLHWLAEHAVHVRHRSLTGSLQGLYRLRSGDYRVIYQVLTAERAIVVHAVGHRRDVYRRR